MDCKHCNNSCVKAGFSKGRIQKFRCRGCKRYQQKHYERRAYYSDTNGNIIRLLVEGIGIRGISRVLKIAIATVMQRIKQIAKSIRKPLAFTKNGIYEIDELWTYVTRKTNETWLMYISNAARSFPENISG
jgi:insertion element IS1 protein InsB